MYTKLKPTINKQEKTALKEAELGFLDAINKINQIESEAVMIRYDYEALVCLYDKGFPELDIKVGIGDYIHRLNERYGENLISRIEQTEEIYRQFRKIINTVYEDIDEFDAWSA